MFQDDTKNTSRMLFCKHLCFNKMTSHTLLFPHKKVVSNFFYLQLLILIPQTSKQVL